MRPKLTIIAAAAALALLVTTVAIGAGEGDPLLGGARNPSPNQTLELQRETEIIANNASYGTRQSNKSNNGGGAIYGCRSLEGGTPANNEPCIRANNLSRGLAFEFETDGALGGTIKAEGGDNARPFTTNATGVATGLNADRLDGLEGEQLRPAFAQVAANGNAGANRGVVSTARDGEGNYTVVLEGDRSACAINATIAGTEGGEISFAQAVAENRTTVDVRTFDSNGQPQDRAFHITSSC